MTTDSGTAISARPLPFGSGQIWRRKSSYAIFFLSGVAGLGYQMVWMRMLAVGLGHEIPSVLAVVAAYFGGLALGGWLLDARISRSPRPGLWYVNLELVIGLWGLLSIVLIPLANELAIAAIGVDSPPVRHWVIALVVPLVVLLPATTAMGATLPAMDRFVAAMTPDGRCIGGLYAANTFGAVVGTLGGAFVVIPHYGFRLTIAVLAGVNLLCASATFLVARRRRHAPSAEPVSTGGPLSRRRIFITVFATGLLGIGYEVIGVRMMSQVLENTVYSFAAALSVYLIGTAGGAAIYQRLSHRADLRRTLFLLLVALSVSCLLGGVVLRYAQDVYRAGRGWFGTGLTAVLARELLVAAMIFGLPTIVMGATFSHLVQAARHARGGVGRAAAVNTLGGALAPALFGVALLPTVGAKWVWTVVSLGYLALLPRPSGRSWILPVGPLVLFAFLPNEMRFLNLPPHTRVAAYREGVMASVAVLVHDNGDRGLTINNHFQMGGTDARVPEQRQALIPLLLHPSPRRALFLGVGTGMTLSGAYFDPAVQCEAVELVPEIVDLLPSFSPENGAPTERSEVTIRVADARRFIRATRDRYDVIVADLFHPARDGAGTLYTVEQFEAVRARLADGGLFCQWLPLHQMDEEILRIVTRTFLHVFPKARAYLGAPTLDPPALGLIATRDPIHYSMDWFERRIEDESLRQGAASVGLDTIYELFGSLLADTATLERFSAGAALNTDDMPIVTFRAPAALYRVKGQKLRLTLSLIKRWDSDPTALLAGAADDEAVKRRFADFTGARDEFLRGVRYADRTRFRRALASFLLSAELSGDFSAAYDRCLAAARQNLTINRGAALRILKTLVRAYPDRPEARSLLDELERER